MNMKCCFALFSNIQILTCSYKFKCIWICLYAGFNNRLSLKYVSHTQCIIMSSVHTRANILTNSLNSPFLGGNMPLWAVHYLTESMCKFITAFIITCTNQIMQQHWGCCRIWHQLWSVICFRLTTSDPFSLDFCISGLVNIATRYQM